jgi:hypothetical protein
MCVRCGTGRIAWCTDPYRHGESTEPVMPGEPPAERQPSSEFPATWAGGHALVIEFGDEELTARCQCGAPLGSGTPATSLESFAQPWETHAMTAGR